MAVPFDEAYQLVEQGKIESGIPIVALQWLYIHRGKLRGEWSITKRD
jgi:ADP-ribose pyrophosphatase